MGKDKLKEKKRKSSDAEVKACKKVKKLKNRKEKKIEHPRKIEFSNLTPVSGSESSLVADVELDNFYKENEVTVQDSKSMNLRPFLSFSDVGLHQNIQDEISKFQKPTPIQAISWPYLLAGRDLIGIAETGSGKTFAFGVPAINKIATSPDVNSNKVKCLVISPTRELASQIYDNLVLLSKRVAVDCCCLYGGVPKGPQKEQLKKSQVVIATPGRLLQMIEEGAANLMHVEYLVLDEADRMLEKGFEEDIKRIIGRTNSKIRQTLMFTATWPDEVSELASTITRDFVKIFIGNHGELFANKKITQIVEVVDQFEKDKKLLELLKKYHSESKKNEKVLIFALYKKEAARVERNLKYNGYSVAAIHGDLSQQQRTQALDDFKSNRSNLLLATDVAARGLDIPNVKTVINLTFPLTVEDYVHRIGRTGRAGATGIAHTLFTDQEKHLAGALINVLNGANQPVPDELKKFGTHTKKKEHSAYGAFYKDIDMSKKPKKITFD